MKRLHTFALLTCVLLACADQAPQPPTYTERDSAGIRIVDHRASDTPRVAWTITERPRVSVGGEAGEKWQVLHRVEFAARLSTGDIAVTNGSTREVFVYDSAGKYKLSVGRAGEGPGEFGAPAWVGIQSDSIVVVDEMYPSRINIFDSKGVFARAAPMSKERHLGEAAVYGSFANDTFLLMGRGGRCPEVVAPPGFHWTCVRLFTSNHRTGATNEIPGTFPSMMGDGTPLMLRSATKFAAHGDRFIMAMTHPYEVRRYHQSGKLEWIARIDRPLRPVTPSMIAEYNAEVTKAQSGYSPAVIADIRKRIGGDPRFPDSLSAYDHVLATEDGGAWARQYSYPPDSAPRWDVFDARGIHQGTVTLRPRFHPFQIGSDFILGLGRDSLDLEYVHLFDLVRPRRK